MFGPSVNLYHTDIISLAKTAINMAADYPINLYIMQKRENSPADTDKIRHYESVMANIIKSDLDIDCDVINYGGGFRYNFEFENESDMLIFQLRYIR